MGRTNPSRKKAIALSIISFFGLVALVGPFLIPVSPRTGLPARQLAGSSGRFVKVDGLEIHYIDSGNSDLSSEKPVFLLFHGFASSTFSWREVMEPLSGEGRVIAYDRPAFGLTERTFEFGSRNPYAGDYQPVLAGKLMDALGIERAILVGHSAGGTVALQTALAYPERVEALVLVSPAIYAGGTPSWLQPLFNTPQFDHLGPLVARSLESRGAAFAARAWHNPEKISSEIYEGYALPLKVEKWDLALWEFTKASRPSNLPSRLGELDLPALVVTGNFDQIIPVSDTRRAAQAIRGAQLIEIEDCGHIAQEECPSAFLEAVLTFLGNLNG